MRSTAGSVSGRVSGVTQPPHRGQHALRAQVGAPPSVARWAQKRVPTRSIIWLLTCTNAMEAQGEGPRQDARHNWAPGGRLAIAADLPIS
jgi:hypothetical protein